MNKNKKYGYIYDEKLNMYIPDLSRQKKLANIFLSQVFLYLGLYSLK